MSEKRSLNDRFTDFADAVSEGVSRWWFTTASFIFLVLWVAYGVFIIGGSWFTSATWNFPLNTITTVGEWFLEGFILISTARVEKRNRGLQEHQEVVLEKIESIEEQHDRMLNHLTELEAQNLVLLTKMTAVHKTTVLETPKKERK